MLTLQRVMWAKAAGIQRQTRLDLLMKTLKPSIWSQEDDGERTLPDPVTSLVYFLHYAQQGCQDWDD